MNYYLYDASKSRSKHCIVFDLDQTLVATQEDCELEETDVLDHPSYPLVQRRLYKLRAPPESDSKSEYPFWGVYRPYTEEFLRFCFSYFRVVGVWSAGTYSYVHEIVKNLFHDRLGLTPHIVFTRRDILTNGDTTVGKPLEKMYLHNEVFHRYMKPDNTFIIDDNHTTAIYNKDNIIHIPAYEPKCSAHGLMSDDTALLELEHWFLQEEVRTAVDVRELDKSRIFSRGLKKARDGR